MLEVINKIQQKIVELGKGKEIPTPLKNQNKVKDNKIKMVHWEISRRTIYWWTTFKNNLSLKIMLERALILLFKKKWCLTREDMDVTQSRISIFQVGYLLHRSDQQNIIDLSIDDFIITVACFFICSMQKLNSDKLECVCWK